MAYRDEIARLEAMHSANPEGRVFAHLAEAYRKKGELERAREVLQAGLERHPQYASAHVVMGRVLLDLMESDAADAAFQKVLQLDPHNMVALRARGDIAHAAGHTGEAVRYYRDLVALDPSDEQSVLRLAEIEARSRPAVPAAAPTPTETAPPATPIEEPALEYGEASLPTSAEPEPPSPESVREPPAIAAGAAPATGEDEDLGLGGMLEPTDVGRSPVGVPDRPATPAEPQPVAEAAEPDALAGLGAFEPTGETQPDAVVDLSALGGSFSLAGSAGEPGDEITTESADGGFGPPALEEDAAAGMSTPIPSAPAGEPEPAPGPADLTPWLTSPPAAKPPAAAGVDDLRPWLTAVPETSEVPDFAALWKAYDDDSVGAELPDMGPELVTETIGDLYADQGLHHRAAEVYAKLATGRPDDVALRDKLEAARAKAAGAGPVPRAEPEKPVPEPFWLEPETAPGAAEPSAGEAAPLPPAEEIFWLEPEPFPGAAEAPAPTETPAAAQPPAPPAAPDEPFWLEPEPFAQTEDAGLPEPLPLELPELYGGAPDVLPWEEPSQAPPELVSMADLGIETIGGGDVDALEPPASEPDLEHVESAWTGGAGAAADIESPFGWSEPEAASSQGTIGEYLAGLVAFTPPAEPASPPPGEPAAPPTPGPSASSGFDDIDALFGGTESAKAPSADADDIDALFADVSAEPARPVTPPRVPEPTPAPATREPTPASPREPEPAEAAGGFEWDPFAELTSPVAPPRSAPAESPKPAEPEPPAPPAPASDDDDVDMFRAWLQSLKR